MSDLISKKELIKHLEKESGMNTPEWLRETIENAPAEKVYVVTCQDGREAPHVAIFDNETAAEEWFNARAEEYDRVWLVSCMATGGEE